MTGRINKVFFLRILEMTIKTIFLMYYRISDALFSITIHPLLIAVNLGSDVHELFGKAGTIPHIFHVFVSYVERL